MATRPSKIVARFFAVVIAWSWFSTRPLRVVMCLYKALYKNYSP